VSDDSRPEGANPETVANTEGGASSVSTETSLQPNWRPCKTLQVPQMYNIPRMPTFSRREEISLLRIETYVPPRCAFPVRPPQANYCADST
jgi:hypothetical protein